MNGFVLYATYIIQYYYYKADMTVEQQKLGLLIPNLLANNIRQGFVTLRPNRMERTKPRSQ